MLVPRQGFMVSAAAASPYGTRIMYPASTNQSYAWTNRTAQGFVNTPGFFGTGAYLGSTSGSTASYIQTVTVGPATNVGAGDFCVEGWLYYPTSASLTNSRCLIVNNTIGGGLGGLGIRLGTAYNTNVNAISVFARATADCENVAYTWPRDQWIHWCAQRDTANNVISFWAGGTLLSPVVLGPQGSMLGRTLASRTTTSSAQALTIGSFNSTGTTASAQECINGMILDEVCVSNCVRYTYNTNLTPPTVPLYVDTQTQLLMHFDGTQGQRTYTNATA